MIKLWLILVALAIILWLANKTESGPLIIQPLPYPKPHYVVVAVGPQESLEVPWDFAEATHRVFFCESTWRPGSINTASGARGIAQIHPAHFPRMRSLGLDPEREGDLMKFAVILWQEEGLEPWESSRECWSIGR